MNPEREASLILRAKTLARNDAERDRYAPSTEPITRPAEDRLGRRDFAQRIVRSLSSWDLRRTGLVVGIEGSWGEGKSSLAAIMRADLTQEGFLVREFNPWLVTSPDAITAEFLRLLTRLLGDLHWNDDERSRVRRLIQSYVPAVLGLLADTAGTPLLPRLILGTSSALVAEFFKAPDLITQREQLAALLAESKQRMAIVVEDVDRLTPSESIRVATLIRLVAGFPNVLYILPYDRKHLAALLGAGMNAGTESLSMGEGLLQRLVQFDITLPKASDAEMGDLLSSELVRAAEAANLDLASPPIADALRDFTQLHFLGAKRFFPTPRSITRFCASVSLAMRAAADRVHLGDLLTVELLRIAVHDTYRKLRDDPHRYVGGGSLAEQLQRSADEVAARSRNKSEELMTELLTDVDEADRSAVTLLLRHIAPTLGHPTDDRQARVERRFRAPEYTERYFRLGIPPDDVDDTVLASALEAAAARDASLLLELIADTRTGEAVTYRIADLAISGSPEARHRLRTALETVAPLLRPVFSSGLQLSPWQRLALVYGQLLLLEPELDEADLRANLASLPDAFVAYGLRAVEAPANGPTDAPPDAARLGLLRRYGAERLRAVLQQPAVWNAISPLGMYVAVLAAWDTDLCKLTVGELIDAAPEKATMLLRARVSTQPLTSAKALDLAQLEKEVDPKRLLGAVQRDPQRDGSLIALLEEVIRRRDQARSAKAQGAGSRLDDLLRTSAGIPVAQLAGAGATVINEVRDAFDRAFAQAQLPEAIEARVMSTTGGVTFTLPGYQQVPTGGEKVYVTLQSSVPAAGAGADVALFVGSPKLDTPLVLIFEKPDEQLAIHPDEVYPEITPAFRARLSAWAERCRGLLINRLEQSIAATQRQAQ